MCCFIGSVNWWWRVDGRGILLVGEYGVDSYWSFKKGWGVCCEVCEISKFKFLVVGMVVKIFDGVDF